MRIGIDAMGGDYAPGVIAEGVKLASSRCKCGFVLFGDEVRLKTLFPSLSEYGGIFIVNAPQVGNPDESTILSILRKHRTSVNMAMQALALGEVDAVVSAGDSRTVVAAGKHYIGLAGNVRRPVLGVFVPVEENRDILLVDAGAYMDFHAISLVQAALVGRIYWRIVKGDEDPSIALLNMGKEKTKGPVEVRRAAALLKNLPINFVGFVEPQDFFCSSSTSSSSSCEAKIVVSNGFVGNVLLKLYESLSENLIKSFERFFKSFFSLDFELFEKWRKNHSRYRYEWTGGAPLLGLKKTVVVAHGRSGPFAIASAISKAVHLVQSNFSYRMVKSIESDSTLMNVRQLYKSWALSKLTKGL